MKMICNDPILIELKEVTGKKKFSANELADLGIKIKQKVLDLVNDNAHSLNVYRNTAHLQNELIRMKKENLKKK
jgi:hypothetical protein